MSVLPPAQKEDVYPWRFNRRLSYLRRPLLWMDEDGDELLVWGVGSLEQAVEYLVNLCIHGRLKAESKAMKDCIGKLRQIESEAFNDMVADVFERAGALVRRRVKKIGGQRVNPGDIDVLVVIPSECKILAVETKDLSVAKTPAEIDHQIRDVFDPMERSAAVKHKERIEWLARISHRM